MAATSIWSVKGWLGKVVAYVMNPEKTENISEQDLMCQYVSGINCSPQTVRQEMTSVKKRYGKDGGIVAYHGYQSFAPGECTPAIAHEIGVKLAEELWGGRFQVLVTTHLDKTQHLHNHFVVNSVSFLDGLRYHRTKKDYQDMKKLSDRLCLEHGLSVIEHPAGKGKHYGEWRAEQEERPTYRGLVKADIDDAIVRARTEKQFFHYLKEKGYTFKIGKDITVRPAGRERGLKLARNFGREYSIEAIRRRILQHVERESHTKSALPEVRSPKLKKQTGGLRGLYLYYCFQLGILPKNKNPVNGKPVYFMFKEDLLKMETISREARLLCHYRIDTAEQLFSLQKELRGKMEELTEQRQHLRYRLRNLTDPQMQEKGKSEIAGLTGQIGDIRKELKLCDGIFSRSENMKKKLDQAEKMKTVKREEMINHEHIRRSSRSDR